MTLWEKNKQNAGWQLVAIAMQATLATLSSSSTGGHTPRGSQAQVSHRGGSSPCHMETGTKREYKVFNFGKQCLGHSLNAFK